LLFSCASAGVTVQGDSGVLSGFKSIAFIELLLTPPSYPAIPIIDAGFYREAGIKAAAQQITEQKTVVNDFYNALTKAFKEIFQGTILGGDELIKSNEYLGLSSIAKTYNTTTAVKVFPNIIIPDGSLNFIDYSGSNDIIFDIENMIKVQKENIAKICNSLQVDAIMIGFVYVETIDVAIFGISGNKWLRTKLFIINKNGEIAVRVDANGAPVNTGAQDMKSFKLILGQFDGSIKMIISKMFP
jgi:hypothetical protein